MESTLTSRVLIAVPDTMLRHQITAALSAAGFLADEALDGIAALKCMRRSVYGLIVLDAELPELSGLMVCREIRQTSAAPVIFVSGLSSEEDRLAGFLAGGNDYMVKPVSVRELLARIGSFLSLTQDARRDSDLLTAGGLRVDGASRAVYVDGRAVQLTPKEYDLLCFLLKHPRRVFSRDALLDLVWGRQFLGSDRTVDSHVKSLREKIHPYQDCIVTVWGIGYKLEM